MFALSSSSTVHARIHRLVALGGAMLVVLLATLAVSPQLHGWLHSDTPDNDDGCAVVLFSNGVALAAGAIAVTPPPTQWQQSVRPLVAEIFLGPVRYLHQPGRGPPVG